MKSVSQCERPVKYWAWDLHTMNWVLHSMRGCKTLRTDRIYNWWTGLRVLHSMGGCKTLRTDKIYNWWTGLRVLLSTGGCKTLRTDWICKMFTVQFFVFLGKRGCTILRISVIYKWWEGLVWLTEWRISQVLRWELQVAKGVVWWISWQYGGPLPPPTTKKQNKNKFCL